tara:strand:+ start:242 stop:547 length:306 start_codon:yes stop_codon:yes gene_type:complete
VEIWVAIITGVFSLVGLSIVSLTQIRELRQENTDQHSHSIRLLSRVDERSEITLGRVENLSTRLDSHLETDHGQQSRRLRSVDETETSTNVADNSIGDRPE